MYSDEEDSVQERVEIKSNAKWKESLEQHRKKRAKYDSSLDQEDPFAFDGSDDEKSEKSY